MTNVAAEIASWKIVNRVEDLLAALPGDTSPVARQAIEAARDALSKAADAFADASEARAH